jgi:hypothetical protein
MTDKQAARVKRIHRLHLAARLGFFPVAAATAFATWYFQSLLYILALAGSLGLAWIAANIWAGLSQCPQCDNFFFVRDFLDRSRTFSYFEKRPNCVHCGFPELDQSNQPGGE